MNCIAFTARAAATEVDTPGGRLTNLVDGIPITRRCRKRGDFLFRAGTEFHALHVLSAGFAKSICVSQNGHERISGFHLRGDILGLDAIASGAYGSDVVALDVCEVLTIPYNAVIEQSQRNFGLICEINRAFSAELRSHRDWTLARDGLPADGKVAAFLIEMSERFGSRGFSATQLQLRLSRSEIGSMLGLKMETVSRVFSRLAKLGLIGILRRQLVLLDCDGLRDLVAKSSRPMRVQNSPSFEPLRRTHNAPHAVAGAW